MFELLAALSACEPAYPPAAAPGKAPATEAAAGAPLWSRAEAPDMDKPPSKKARLTAATQVRPQVHVAPSLCRAWKGHAHDVYCPLAMPRRWGSWHCRAAPGKPAYGVLKSSISRPSCRVQLQQPPLQDGLGGVCAQVAKAEPKCLDAKQARKAFSRAWLAFLALPLPRPVLHEVPVPPHAPVCVPACPCNSGLCRSI